MSHTTQVEPTPAAPTSQPIGPANPGQPVIEVSDLRVTYRGSTTPAVDRVSFGVAAGEVFGFLGPSGAGGSTS
jgi:ABC-type glutathione transport system ATPase component